MRGVTIPLCNFQIGVSISTHTPHARRDREQCFNGRHFRISTHTPHARRDPQAQSITISMAISTHTPHARRDPTPPLPEEVIKKFLLTRLMRGVTRKALSCVKGYTISTHTPHARRDPFLLSRVKCTANFYSHASCEA